MAFWSDHGHGGDPGSHSRQGVLVSQPSSQGADDWLEGINVQPVGSYQHTTTTQSQEPAQIQNQVPYRPPSASMPQNIYHQQFMHPMAWSGYQNIPPYATIHSQPPQHEPPQQQLTVDPSMVLAQRYHSHSYGNYTTEPPHMTVNPSQVMQPPQYSQQQQQQQHLQQHSQSAFAYSNTPTSSTIATPPVLSAEEPSTRTPTPAAAPSPTETKPNVALLEKVRKLLTPKRLDSSPQTIAQGLISLLTKDEDLVIDKATRLEVLTRVRDNAPKEFFATVAKSSSMIFLLKDWTKAAVKGKNKDEFEDTLMPLLQVLDRLPIDIEGLKSSGFGKLILAVRRDPATSAIGDMATKIENHWRSIAKESTTVAENPKKRKLAEPATKAPPAKRVAGAITSTPNVPVKKEVVTGKSPLSAATTAAGSNTKSASSDASFFSSKPKPKLPSFRKVKPPAPSGSATAAINAAIAGQGEGMRQTSPTDVSKPMDVDAFADAMKSLKKRENANVASSTANGGDTRGGSPLSRNGTPLGVTSGTTSGTPSGMMRNGKPKKTVRFPPDSELEQIKYIEKAIYDDDDMGAKVHGRSLADLQREEGSLLKHKLVELIEWVEPAPIDYCLPPSTSGKSNALPVERGSKSVEAGLQETREASTLAAMYLGQPPDTPIEPPGLLTGPADGIDKETKMMVLSDLEGGIGGVPGATPVPQVDNIHSLIGQLLQPQQTPGQPTASGMPDFSGLAGLGGQAGNGASIADLLSRLQSLNGAVQPQQQQQQQQLDPLAALLQTVNGSAGGNIPTGPAAGYDNSGYGYGQQQQQQGAHLGLPEPMGRNDRRGGDRPPPPRGRGNDGKVPASQNTRRPLCTFFAQGRCRYGEDCDFSHDLSKLGNPNGR